MLEASLYADNAFLTLTYGDDPVTLVPLHHRQFMDALRKRLRPLRVRFYMVGEYGDKHQRPHFHYALFGYPSCRRAGLHRRDRARYHCCPPCDVLADVWGKGFIYNKPLELASARYICKYVIKGMTRGDDPRLGNRAPEFSRMSLKPGIGHGVLEKIAATITRYNLLTREGDVPVTLAHGGREMPLGRYLRKKLRKHLGLDERSPHVLTAEAAHAHYWSEEVRPVRELQAAARADPHNPSLKAQFLKASEGERLQLARRNKTLKTKDKL